MRQKPAILLSATWAICHVAQAASMSLGQLTLQTVERHNASGSDALLIQGPRLSLAVDLNRSAGLAASAQVTPDGVLVAGPYVLNPVKGTVQRRSLPGYRALTSRLDGRLSGQQIDLAEGAHHWHCRLPARLPLPFSLAPSWQARVPSKASPTHTVLMLGRQQDPDSGITTVRAMRLVVPGCRLQQAPDALAFDHAMLIAQAGRTGWWTYSTSDPQLAITQDGLHWTYPALPDQTRTLLSAFIGDDGSMWIAISITDDSAATQIWTQGAGSTSWRPVALNVQALPAHWLEGRLLAAQPEVPTPSSEHGLKP